MLFSELFATIICSCSFLRPIYSQWKRILALYIVYFQVFFGELADISICVKTHSLSNGPLLIHSRSEWLQHCSQLLIFAISSKLSNITHLFIIINHWNPSAAFDNSYRRLAKLRTWPGVFKAGRQVLELTLPLWKDPCFLKAVYCRQPLRNGRAASVSKLRWSFCRDMEEEVEFIFKCICV